MNYRECMNGVCPAHNVYPYPLLTHWGRYKMDAIFTCIFFNENCCILIKLSLKYVRKGPIDNNPALVQIMAWRRSGDKPLSEPIMISLPTHICGTRPQWVKYAILTNRLVLLLNVLFSEDLQYDVWVNPTLQQLSWFRNYQKCRMQPNIDLMKFVFCESHMAICCQNASTNSAWWRNEAEDWVLIKLSMKCFETSFKFLIHEELAI